MKQMKFHTTERGKHMEINGIVTSLTTDGNETVITIKTKQPAAEYEKMVNADVDVKIDICKTRRSKKANACYHALCGKIARAKGMSMTEICNEMLAKYGIEEKGIYVFMREDKDWRKLSVLHLKPKLISFTNGKGIKYRCYRIMKPTHECSTSEMNALINGAIHEAKALGIQIRV